MSRLGDGVQTRGAVISRSPSLPLRHRTKEAIAEGRLCVEQAMPMLKKRIGSSSRCGVLEHFINLAVT
jgi:hypothetical protein